MLNRELCSWDEFLVKYKALVDLRAKKMEQFDAPGIHFVSSFLFRGQANATWRLQTTLERYTQRQTWGMHEYYRRMDETKVQIETYTGKLWQDAPTPDEYETRLQKINNPHTSLDILPCYENMVYLRHHGFPSPLLDWSQTPYIAAFFAFNGATPGQSEPVAIYAFLEQTGYYNPVPGGPAKPTWVVGIRPNVRSHKRHFLQQSEYTICCTRCSDDGVWSYDSHEKVLLEKSPERLWKFSIPVSERAKVLHLLDRTYNINASSLFESEESLMETVAARAFLHPR
jgi:hypothetical protein